MKRLLKGTAQHAVAAAAPLWWKLHSRPRLLILMYHRVLPAGHPERATEQAGMYVSPETLRMHLEVLARHFVPIHLDDWIIAVEQGKSVPPASCALTFDDGWLDNYRYAYPVLKASGTPATIYLVSDLVGSRYVFWPNRLARLLAKPVDGDFLDRLPSELRAIIVACAPEAGTGKKPLSRAQVDGVIAACKLEFSDSAINELLDGVQCSQSNNVSVSHERDLMNWDEIRSMAGDDQIRFGSHSRRHTRLLASLPDESAADEIAGSGSIIRAQLGKQPVTFCYPNGDHSLIAVELVRRHYRAAVTTQRGWNEVDNNRFLLNRVGVHEDVSSSPAALLSRLAGVG